MLSILIPVYNHDVTELVNTLNNQAMMLGREYEIIIADDCSYPGYRIANRRILSHPRIRYVELDANTGRSAIRNFLAAEAKHAYLLFIDCDARVCRPDFLARYLEMCSGDRVVCGGTIYTEEIPGDPGRILRWKYGRSRESVPARRRRKHPYASFSAFNFLISAGVFSGIRFDEEIASYGHEDTVFGYRLRKSGIPCIHIDNALLHVGLEDCHAFLAKTEAALENLVTLYLERRLDRDFVGSIRMLQLVSFLGSRGLQKATGRLLGLAMKRFKKNLTGPRPAIWILQLYKTGAFLEKLRARTHGN